MRITKREPTTPGEMLQEGFMKPYGLTQGQLAELLGVERRRINEFIVGRRKLTADTARRLARLFGNTPQFWMKLQLKTDLWEALHNNPKEDEYESIQPLSALEQGDKVRV